MGKKVGPRHFYAERHRDTPSYITRFISPSFDASEPGAKRLFRRDECPQATIIIISRKRSAPLAAALLPLSRRWAA